MLEMNEREKARFWVKVNETATCWEWTSSLNKYGYGVFGLKGKVLRAHRISYELVNGELKSNDIVMHTCDNPKCVNPDHLISSNQDSNIKDCLKKGRFRLGKYSKYRGVGYRPDTKKWRAYFMEGRKQINLGCYASEDEAAKAYDDYVNQNHRDKFPLNLNLEVALEK